jgi:hypothetical protein
VDDKHENANSHDHQVNGSDASQCKADTNESILDTPLFFPEPTIHVRMTDAQQRMVHWLNALDPVKHLAWYPDVANSHAVIIARDPARFPVHDRGRGVLRHWASNAVKAAVT